MSVSASAKLSEAVSTACLLTPDLASYVPGTVGKVSGGKTRA
ncbi:MAG: hypothetical protein PVJ86_01570 [Phycisphaerales bacterium]